MNNTIVPIRTTTPEPQPFDFNGQQVRVVMDGDKPWFVATDVARILGYDHTPSMVRTLDDKHKGVRPVHTLGGDQEMTVLSEPGLWKACAQRQTGRMVDDARRAFIEAFQDWVFEDVLPQIRKTGSYGQPKELSDSEIVHQALQITSRQVEELRAENAILKPESEAWRGLSRAIGDFVIADAAKIVARVGCKTGPGRLHKQIEHEWKWIFRRGEKNKRVVYQGVIDKGWMVARITSGYIDQITGERKNGTPEPRITVEGVGEIARRLGGDPEAAMAAAREEIRNQEAEASA